MYYRLINYVLYAPCTQPTTKRHRIVHKHEIWDAQNILLVLKKVFANKWLQRLSGTLNIIMLNR